MDWPCQKLASFTGDASDGTLLHREMRPRAKELDDAAILGTPLLQSATATMLQHFTIIENRGAPDFGAYDAALESAVSECSRTGNW